MGELKRERGHDRLEVLVRTQPYLAEYARDLTQVLHETGVGIDSFREVRPQHDVVAMAATLLGHLEMDHAFLTHNSTNTLLTLGIADAYLTALRDRSLSEGQRKQQQESLLLALGIASYEFTTKGMVTHSGYMAANFDNKLRRIKPLTQPPVAQKTAAERRMQRVSVDATIEATVDELATRRFAHEGKIGERPVRAYIESVADRLGIPHTAIPSITFKILAVSAKGILGLDAMTSYYSDGRIEIALPQDFTEHNAEHEIIHALTRGVTMGFGARVGGALNEALTESLTREPVTYALQRSLLDEISVQMGPVFKHHLLRAYIHGDRNSETTALTMLVHQFGIQAIYQLFFASSGTIQMQVNEGGFIDRTFLPVESVKAFFRPRPVMTAHFLEPEVIH